MQQDTAEYIKHEYGHDGLEKDRLSKRDFKEAAKDWKFYGVILFNICASVPTQAFSIFLPLVLQGLGYTSIRANLVSPPNYHRWRYWIVLTSLWDDCAAIHLWCRWALSVCLKFRPSVSLKAYSWFFKSPQRNLLTNILSKKGTRLPHFDKPCNRHHRPYSHRHCPLKYWQIRRPLHPTLWLLRSCSTDCGVAKRQHTW